jgi:hypothetical protein
MLGSGNPEPSAAFRRGERVTIRSAEEILSSLDPDGKFEGLPFMPEMAPLCGKTFTVHRRADKTCVEGVGMRSLPGAVFLDGLRCDGSAHGGCQRGCLLFWKEAWLKAAASDSPAEDGAGRQSQGGDEAAAALARLPTAGQDCYRCQSTELAGAASDAPPGVLRYHLGNLWTGETTFRGFARFLRIALPNGLWRLLRGRAFYRLTGRQKRTAAEELNLEAGELVEIKSAAEIRATLDTQGRNRGLRFEPEMIQYCGRRFRVATPVRTIISEQTGKMIQLTNTVRLEGIVCEGTCSGDCPRGNHFFWREAWLKRV